MRGTVVTLLTAVLITNKNMDSTDGRTYLATLHPMKVSSGGRTDGQTLPKALSASYEPVDENLTFFVPLYANEEPCSVLM